MNKSILLALATAGTLLSAGAAHAADVSWSVGINLPGIVLPLPPLPGLVVTGGPVYAEPVYREPRYREPVRAYVQAPIYAPVPVYQPEFVRYQPEPVYHPRHPQWRHHYRPAPVVEVSRHPHGWQPASHAQRRDERRDERRDHRDDRRDHRDDRRDHRN